MKTEPNYLDRVDALSDLASDAWLDAKSQGDSQIARERAALAAGLTLGQRVLAGLAEVPETANGRYALLLRTLKKSREEVRQPDFDRNRRYWS